MYFFNIFYFTTILTNFLGTTITLTINKFAEEKECEVKINVAKLTGYTPKVETTTKETNKNEEKDTSKETETGTESDKDKETGSKDTQTQVKVEPEKVTVAIYVNDSEYDTGSTTKDDTNYTRIISAKGTVKIKIEIKDASGNKVTKTSKPINLNETNSVVFE